MSDQISSLNCSYKIILISGNEIKNNSADQYTSVLEEITKIFILIQTLQVLSISHYGHQQNKADFSHSLISINHFAC